ncbi:MAG TPA: hypothetical protein VJB95_01360 [Candidatus Paceibacterota bacterium]
MGFSVDGYDLEFAIQIRQIMLHTPWQEDNEERKTLVWDPSQDFLQRLADAHPHQLICFFGREFNFPQKPNCLCKNIFITNQNHQAAYLGTVFNKEATIAYRDRVTAMGEPITSHHFMRIIRDQTYYIIPSKTSQLSERAVLDATRRYLQSYENTSIPSLASARICLLSADKGSMFDDIIRQVAQERANKN